MSMSIYNNATPVSLHERMERGEKDKKMGMGRLAGSRVDDGLDHASGLPQEPAANTAHPSSDRFVTRTSKNGEGTNNPSSPANQAIERRALDADVAKASADYSRKLIQGRSDDAVSAQANQNQRAAMRLLQERS